MAKKMTEKENGYRLLCVSLVLVLIMISFSGCGKKEQPANKASAVEGRKGRNEIVVAINSETGSLDPAGMIALTYLAYAEAALDELVTYDADGNLEYRAAESYEVNEDATEWTFHLRKSAVWSDGTPVTSADFLNTMVRSLDPKSGNGYANYLFPIQNAEKIYNQEESADALGVETPDDFTLIFHLEEPCVYFLDLLRLPVYTPSCVSYADKVGSGWDKNPKTSVANGPFYLAEYEPEQYFVLKKNENYWNAGQINLDQITYRFFDTQEAMLMAYTAEEVDAAASLPASVLELYKGQKDLFVTDTIATRYIYPNLHVKPLEDVRVRKAINLAIDREELCQMVGADTEPTYNLVAKYMKDKTTGEYFVEQAEPPFSENVEEAKNLLAQAGYPDGEGFPQLTYYYPSLEQDSDTAQVLKEQLKRNLNIEIELQAQELQVNYTERRAGNFDLCRMNWTADFSDPYTYLSMLLSNSTYNCSGIRDAQYDALVEASNVEKDPAKRRELLHEAEQLAVGEQFYIIPLYAVKSCNLIRPEVTGVKQNPATGTLVYRYAAWD